MSTRRTFLLATTASLLFAGCGQGRPQGFPRPYPCKITVKNGGQSVEGAQVVLFNSADRQSQTVVAGTTDANGVAEIFTSLSNYKESGAPTGEYSVMIKKDVILEGLIPADEVSKMGPIEAAKYGKELEKKRAAAKHETPPATESPNSPVKLSVKSEPVTLEVNVAEYSKK